MLNIRHFVFNPFQENTYVLSEGNSSEAVIVDPGCDPGREQESFFGWLETQRLRPVAVLLTHAHPDHRSGAKAIQDKFGVPVYMCEAEKTVFKLDFTTTPLEDGQKLDLGGLHFEVITTPGHTPGGVCYYLPADKALMTGDTLFRGTIGRTDLKGGEYDDLIVSIMDKVMGLDGDVQIFPGHGSSSTLSDERTNNPFLQPFNEPWEGIDSID
ncbi:MAG: MBL fold metallo-hydrolase [Bacteroidales bacterium]|nr:MBL fold metallo-hydrolase [Bacteroidales bacterium]